MTISSLVKIGGDTVDLARPCDVAMALKKVELAIASGGKAETVRFGEDEVTFTRANLARLSEMIRTYEDRCQRAGGGSRRRFAKPMTFG
ncbi:hypothetical protein [Amorphus orientalis]|uniref:Uncharacterized protein n=1 Tax=Amorphus orientalis TaxID=649198 RepID=A0AAE3VMT6_9HYPH|nr:hypothetical protein [Amorphus orientalis]MDQ0314842.1 hypothetical protein [Amorphus orientalis]